MAEPNHQPADFASASTSAPAPAPAPASASIPELHSPPVVEWGAGRGSGPDGERVGVVHPGDEGFVVTAELVSSDSLGLAFQADGMPAMMPGGLAAAVYRPPPPRIWTVFLAAIVAIPAAIAVSATIGVVWLVLRHGPTVFQDKASVAKRLEEITTTPFGLVAMVVPGQAVFFAVALCGAFLSPQPWRERLRLVGGRLPAWTWIPLACATPAIANMTSLALSQVFETQSEHLRQMEDLFRRFDARWLPVLFLVVAGLPSIAEEFLFRGFMQSRLARAWPPLFAILLCGLMFGAAHLDPMHSIAVVPLGVWLGLIAHRCDSLWPAILGHVVNNGLALAMMRFFQTEALAGDPSMHVVAIVLSAASYLSLLVGIAILVRKDPATC